MLLINFVGILALVFAGVAVWAIIDHYKERHGKAKGVPGTGQDPDSAA